ncbi:MAG: peroxidase [Bradyrhizobium sp.]|nr:peroxidase [Bradyrhizobium sp.]
MQEPDLQVDDIQGHVLVGFGGGFQALIGLRLHAGTLGQARQLLLDLAPRITPGRASVEARGLRRAFKLALGPTPDPADIGLTISFSHPGLQLLGNFEGPEDVYFRGGAASAASALKDDVDDHGNPVGWSVGGTDDTTPHVFIVLAGMDQASVSASAADLVAAFAPVADIVFNHDGSRLPGECEHFGFVDGISQPGPRGMVDGVPLIERSLPAGDPEHEFFARPGQPLIWPGQYVFGYPTQQVDSADAGLTAGEGVPLLRNGSILVFRKLQQHVQAFRTAVAQLAADFTAAGVPVDAAKAAAWCVGRWPDGTPVSLSPAREDRAISGSTVLRNGFLYQSPCPANALTIAGAPVAFPGASDDASGYACPFFSHIRKVNPRDMPVDQGGSGITLRSQMLRRGVPYGPAWTEDTDATDRGLMFLSYQTSIENQFHRLMTFWVNSGFAPPPTPQGIDPLIGAPGTGRLLTRRPPDNHNYRATLPGRFVTTTGAGYFFTPGIAAYRAIVQGVP